MAVSLRVSFTAVVNVKALSDSDQLDIASASVAARAVELFRLRAKEAQKMLERLRDE